MLWTGSTGSHGCLVIGEGEVQTYDMGGTATTIEMAEAIADKL